MKEFVQFVGHARGGLVGYAAKICVMYAYGGAPTTAKYINTKLGTKFSARPIIDIVDKVKAGKIIVSNDEIVAAAMEDPKTQAFIERFRAYLPSGQAFNGALLAHMNPRSRKLIDGERVVGSVKQASPSGGDFSIPGALHEVAQPMAASGLITAEEAERQASLKEKLQKRKN